MSKAIITEQHLHDIADAIIAKGGATAPMTPAQMPAAIQTISCVDPVYWSMLWGNLENPFSILDQDNQKDENGVPYPCKVILFYAFMHEEDNPVITGGEAYRTSDGHFYTGSTMDATVEKSNNSIWVIAYGHSPISVASHLLPSVYYSHGNAGAIFNFDYRSENDVITRKAVRAIAIVGSGEIVTGSQNQRFRRCLAYVCTGIDLEITSCQLLFYDSISMIIPDNIDLTGCSAADRPFTATPALVAVPRNVRTNLSLTFDIRHLIRPDSLARFDVVDGVLTCPDKSDDPDLSYGLVNNINPCSNSAQKIAFSNSRIKSFFSDGEIVAIEAALNAKNWTIAW